MATVETIGTTGRNYSTLQAWEDAVPATPTGGYEGHCYNDSEFSAGVIIDGHTTSAANYVLLTAATGQSFQDHASVRSNALIYDQTKGVGISAAPFAEAVIRIADENVVVSRLQIKRTAGSYAAPAVDIDAAVGGTDTAFKDCIVQKTYSGNDVVTRIRLGSAFNVVSIDTGGGSSTGLSAFGGGGGLIHSCTIVRSSGVASGGTGIGANYNPIVQNTAIFGWNAVSSGTFDASSGFNGTDGASAPGSDNQTSLTYANQFESTSADWRIKSDSALVDAGSTSATHAPNDISGTARGLTTDGDIGAWEISGGGGGGGSLLLFVACDMANIGDMRGMRG